MLSMKTKIIPEAGQTHIQINISSFLEKIAIEVNGENWCKALLNEHLRNACFHSDVPEIVTGYDPKEIKFKVANGYAGFSLSLSSYSDSIDQLSLTVLLSSKHDREVNIDIATEHAKRFVMPILRSMLGDMEAAESMSMEAGENTLWEFSQAQFAPLVEKVMKRVGDMLAMGGSVGYFADSIALRSVKGLGLASASLSNPSEPMPTPRAPDTSRTEWTRAMQCSSYFPQGAARLVAATPVYEAVSASLSYHSESMPAARAPHASRTEWTRAMQCSSYFPQGAPLPVAATPVYEITGALTPAVILTVAQFNHFYKSGHHNFNGARLLGINLGDNSWSRVAKAASNKRLSLNSEQLQDLYCQFLKGPGSPDQVALCLHLIKHIMQNQPDLQVLSTDMIQAFLLRYQSLRQREFFKWSDFGKTISAIESRPRQSLCIMEHYLEKKQAKDLSARTVKALDDTILYPTG